MKRFFKNPIITNSLKAALVLGLLVFLAKRGFLSLDATKKAFSDPNHIIPAYFCFFLAAFLNTIRWHYLLRLQNIHLPFGRTLQLMMVGYFFNVALPGAVTGDIIKGVYAAKDSSNKRAAAFSSVLFDRVLGLSALIMIATIATFFSWDSPWAHDLFAAVFVFVTCAGVAVVAFYAYLFGTTERYDPLLRIFKAAEKKNTKAGSFVRMWEGIRNYRQFRGGVALAFGLSLIMHFLVITGSVQAALAIGESQIHTDGLFIIIPLGLLMIAVPLSPGGLGTGHAAFAALFALLGSQRGADIFSLFVLSNITLGALGGIVYLQFKSKGADVPITAAKVNDA